MHALGHALALSGPLDTVLLQQIYDTMSSLPEQNVSWTLHRSALSSCSPVHVGVVKTEKCVTAKGSTPNTIMTLSNQEPERRTALKNKVPKNRYILSLSVSLAYRFVKMNQTRFRLGSVCKKLSLKIFFLLNTTHSHNP